MIRLYGTVFSLIILLSGICSALTINDVDDWTYQLQGYGGNLDTITQSQFDLAVIDYSRTGEEAGEWVASEIADLGNSGPCGNRIVLAYMSIGEAEDYRFYWDPSWVDANGDPTPSAPAWLGPVNPDWPGNYKVRYWQSGWKDIIFGTASGPDKSYLDRIMDQGFDGVYLDIIDAFEFWGPSEIGGNDEERAAPSEMVDFVREIAEYAHNTAGHPDFIIVPQNGSYIIDQDCYPDASDPAAEALAQRMEYFSAVDAIGVEDVFFTGPADENNPYDPDTDRIELINQFRDAGKKVLSVEYLTISSFIQDYYTTYASNQGYVAYATVRALDQMTVNTGFEPDCEATPTPGETLPATKSTGIVLLILCFSGLLVTSQ